MNPRIKTLLEQLQAVYGKRESEAVWRTLQKDLTDLDQPEIMIQALQRVLADEPVQYVTGISWFYGIPFSVNSKVLIPRPETEELVEKAIQILQQKPSAATILDIGTGSGCIAIVVKKKMPEVRVSALDVCSEALEVAMSNAIAHDTDVAFIQADILNPGIQLPESYDLIISNPPYILRSERNLMSASTLAYEPELALFTESDDPLQYYNAILMAGKKALTPLGNILFECSEFHADQVAQLCDDLGYQEINTYSDLQGKVRMVSCRL